MFAIFFIQRLLLLCVFVLHSAIEAIDGEPVALDLSQLTAAQIEYLLSPTDSVLREDKSVVPLENSESPLMNAENFSNIRDLLMWTAEPCVGSRMPTDAHCDTPSDSEKKREGYSDGAPHSVNEVSKVNDFGEHEESVVTESTTMDDCAEESTVEGMGNVGNELNESLLRVLPLKRRAPHQDISGSAAAIEPEMDQQTSTTKAIRFISLKILEKNAQCVNARLLQDMQFLGGWWHQEGLNNMYKKKVTYQPVDVPRVWLYDAFNLLEREMKLCIKHDPQTDVFDQNFIDMVQRNATLRDQRRGIGKLKTLKQLEAEINQWLSQQDLKRSAVTVTNSKVLKSALYAEVQFLEKRRNKNRARAANAKRQKCEALNKEKSVLTPSDVTRRGDECGKCTANNDVFLSVSSMKSDSAALTADPLNNIHMTQESVVRFFPKESEVSGMHTEDMQKVRDCLNAEAAQEHESFVRMPPSLSVDTQLDCVIAGEGAADEEKTESSYSLLRTLMPQRSSPHQESVAIWGAMAAPEKDLKAREGVDRICDLLVKTYGQHIF
ncbi:MAG: hypothetical protein OXC30_05220 [Alphaproteobacteria bacterium]|nr:hypothetical protein [Alphaproteobacteria bacterium]